MAFLSTSRTFLKSWGEVALGLFFPEQPLPGAEPRCVEAPFCYHCGEPFSGDVENHFHCYNCSGRKWHFHCARANVRAEGQVRAAIHAFKYQKHFHHLPSLTDWLQQGFRRFFAQQPWDALVPVALHPRRQRERGFNQAMELSKSLSQRVKIPVWDCLAREKETSAQARLARAIRLRNLRNAFKLKSQFDVQGKNLLLIDDVFTTGATTEACARVLAQAGASYVAVLTVARG